MRPLPELNVLTSALMEQALPMGQKDCQKAMRTAVGASSPAPEEEGGGGGGGGDAAKHADRCPRAHTAEEACALYTECEHRIQMLC